MAISTPVNGRVRFTYPGNLPDLRINGINPTASPINIFSLGNAIQELQTASINHMVLISEFELTED